MSVIVVVRKEDKAVIAADSQWNQGEMVVPSSMRVSPLKILEIKGGYIGITGSSAHHRVFQSIIKNHPTKLNFNGPDNIFETFRSLQKILKEDYHLVDGEDDEDQPYGSNHLFGLLCNQSGIYGFQSYREIIEYNHFWATGSGKEFALGALHSCYPKMDDPREIAKSGIEAACTFDSNCGLPIQMFEVDVIK